MSKSPKTIIKVNELFSISMRPYGWELYTYDAAKQKKPNGKILPKVTHHPTLKMLSQWIINRHVGHAKDFETLIDMLDKAAKNFESEFTVIVKDLNKAL